MKLKSDSSVNRKRHYCVVRWYVKPIRDCVGSKTISTRRISFCKESGGARRWGPARHVFHPPTSLFLRNHPRPAWGRASPPRPRREPTWGSGWGLLRGTRVRHSLGWLGPWGQAGTPACRAPGPAGLQRGQRAAPGWPEMGALGSICAWRPHVRLVS